MTAADNPAHDPECYRRFLPEGEPPPWPCICEPLRLARADERERVVAVVSAARAWVARIIDPPNLWADEVDFALITAVNAYEDAAAIARGADG